MASVGDVTSSSTLWAVPSKEWVIQPKPKPGRKPKKDTQVQPVPDNETDVKGRRVQNRAAQRAFRERKQSQLAELQARIQLYEQGEIERNVALQNIAKKLKEENESLRQENSLLRERMEKIGEERTSTKENDKKRWRDKSPSVESPSVPQRKKYRVGSESPRVTLNSLTVSYLPSPPSMASTPEASGMMEAQFSSLQYEPHQDHIRTPLPSLLELTGNSGTISVGNHFPTYDCGFCEQAGPCVCREFDAEVPSHMGPSFGKPVEYAPPVTARSEIPSSAPSILDDLPDYQPPVPLRRKSTKQNTNSIFPVVPPSDSLPTSSLATCSGDPQNCMACADDNFGKAFCTAIEDIVAGQSQCANCPQDRQCNAFASTSSHRCSAHCGCPSASDRNVMIPTNDAWRQLKAHPNVAFADLSLLADVVSRRSKCAGPRVMISPPPDSIAPDRIAMSATSSASYANPDPTPVSMMPGPRAHFLKGGARPQGSSPPPRLVPEEILMECGRRRVREVHPEGVREALRLLDAKLSRP
ncbi:hypothetical protein BDN72DRAFT_953490 [Pluteus cervinus]|uniref:Uncharacterized protein n=1 Tax=Pluteus cervinus TaxID=181527 RepID=A0ACD3BHG0_9AGAR|nr:hypothetical protein BDN72DRAFT_953490 [Pluteus cervinus]